MVSILFPCFLCYLIFESSYEEEIHDNQFHLPVGLRFTTILEEFHPRIEHETEPVDGEGASATTAEICCTVSSARRRPQDSP